MFMSKTPFIGPLRPIKTNHLLVQTNNIYLDHPVWGHSRQET